MSSSSWMDEYLASLRLRDTIEQANRATIDAYTRLADRQADLEKAAATATQSNTTEQPAAKAPPSSILGRVTRSPEPAPPEDIIRLRTDLVAAHKSYAALEKQLKALQAQSEETQKGFAKQEDDIKALRKQVARLEAERASLQRRLKDRESELREKARLVGEVQDEMVSLEIQMNVADDKAKKLEAENQDLVERYMRRVGKEAEELNSGSGWK